MNNIDFLLRLYGKLILIRQTEQKIAELYPQGKMRCPVHLCTGQEGIPVGVCAFLKPDDYVVGFYRSHGHFLAKGGDPKKLFAELYGKVGGAMGGRGGSMLLADPEIGMMGSSALVAGGIPMGVGLALASKLRRDNRVTVIFFGDAAAEEGVFHESLNFASLKKLPAVFVCENNFYAVASPILNRQPSANIFRFAAPHLIPGLEVDGNDVLAVAGAAKKAINRARTGGGPTLLEFKTGRLRGHIESFLEITDFRSKKEIKQAQLNDPLKRFSDYLRNVKKIDQLVLGKIEEDARKRINSAVAFAEKSPFPEPLTILEHIYP